MMAKKRKRNVHTRVERDAYRIANTLSRLLRPSYLPLEPSVWADDRRWHPAGDLRPVVATFRAATRMQPVVARGSGKATGLLSSKIRFAAPEGVVKCVRRHRRREVLFAKGVGGSRGLKMDRPRNEWSQVSCRR